MAANQLEMDQKQGSASFFSEPTGSSQYTSTSSAAVLALAVGFLSLSGFIFQLMIVLAPLGIVIGIAGLRNCLRYPEEIKGRGLAVTGIVMGLAVFVAAPAYHAYVYMNEVQPGFLRTTWYGDYKVLKGNRLFTERAEELDGQKVFLKGYVRPGLRKSNLSEFLLVGDFNQCCFGGNPKISEIIYVKLKNGQKVDYSWQLRKIHGTFKLNKRLQKGEDVANDILGYVYEIDADDIQ